MPSSGIAFLPDKTDVNDLEVQLLRRCNLSATIARTTYAPPSFKGKAWYATASTKRLTGGSSTKHLTVWNPSRRILHGSFGCHFNFSFKKIVSAVVAFVAANSKF